MFEKWDGRRVTVRRRITDGDGAAGSGGPRFTDAVGELTAVGPDEAVVHTRSGPVRIRYDAVVALREVPPAPPRRASRAAVDRLERLRAAAWPAPVTRPLGGWLLRAADGFSRRANSALVLGDPGVPLPAALDELTRFSAAHGIAPLVQAPVGSPWSHRVQEAGWEPLDDPGECLVLVASLDDTAPDDTQLLPAPPDAWWSAFDEPVPDPGSAAHSVVVGPPWPGDVRPGEQSKAPEVRPGEQSKARSGPSPRTGFGMIVSDDGQAVGAVRAAVVEDHVYVSRLHVRATHRRRGHAGELMRRALGWGRALGARHAVLDVAASNTGARALYERDGWIVHHRYHYLAPGPG